MMPKCLSSDLRMIDFVLLVCLILIKMLRSFFGSVPQKLFPKVQSNNKTLVPTESALKNNKASYIAFQDAQAANTIVVDCTHPSCKTLTHHKNHNNPPTQALHPSDISTGLVINAIHTLETSAPRADNPALLQWMSMPYVAVNHFDGDALFSTWSYINRLLALKHEEVLLAAASLHDFREVPFSVDKDPELFAKALKLCCWINTVERNQFSPPFEDKDADKKFSYFLSKLESFLNDPEVYRTTWYGDYDLVLQGIASISNNVKVYKDISLAIVRCPSPVHYYSLFKHTHGCDVVVSLYDDQRYEVEEKYTQFVNVHSRPVQARLEMGHLAKLLNMIDTSRQESTSWNTPRLVDTGPLLRLDHGGQQLTKAQRYAHPIGRPFFSSGLTQDEFEEVVVSYFRYGLRGVDAKKGGWSWDELHEVNAEIDWKEWQKEWEERFI